MNLSRFLKKQRGAISLFGAASIALSIFGFTQVVEYGNAKILDRELDNYARTVAGVALRTELALTKAGIEAGTMESDYTDQTVDALLAEVGMQMTTDKADLEKVITFGNFDEEGYFVPLESHQSNPRGADTDVPLNFSAVAVQLTSNKSFMGVFTPEGKALYGMSSDNLDANSSCYCKNRYTGCLNAELSPADLSAMSPADADAVSVVGSDARINYCKYGSSQPKSSNDDVSKYSHFTFNDGWIGRPPAEVNFFMFYKRSYDGESFDDILNHKPVMVSNGDDPLKQTSGWSGFFSSFFCFFNCASADFKANESSNITKSFERRDISPSSSRSEYICERPGFMMIPTRYESCSSASNSNKVVLNDETYVGYQGTCVANTNSENLSPSRCLSTIENSKQTYESCLAIEERSALKMGFFARMMAFFMGPILNIERSFEGLDCEMQKMQYKGWMFWGGWEKV